MYLHGLLMCNVGETGNSSVVIATGVFNGKTSKPSVSCGDPAFTDGTGDITWSAPNATVVKSHVTWSQMTITDGTSVGVDLATPNTALTNQVVLGVLKPRSYTGADLNVHIVTDPVPGGLCAGGGTLKRLVTGLGGTSTLAVTPPNPNGLPVESRRRVDAGEPFGRSLPRPAQRPGPARLRGRADHRQPRPDESRRVRRSSRSTRRRTARVTDLEPQLERNPREVERRRDGRLHDRRTPTRLDPDRRAGRWATTTRPTCPSTTACTTRSRPATVTSRRC